MTIRLGARVIIFTKFISVVLNGPLPALLSKGAWIEINKKILYTGLYEYYTNYTRDATSSFIMKIKA